MRQIPIYYINLQSRSDRRAFMEEQFVRLGLQVERIEAVTPADIDECDLSEYSDPRRYEWLSPAELACSLSHVKAMRRLLASGCSYALIFEDDVVISSELPAFLDAFARSPAPFDLVKIEAVDQPLRLRPGNDGVIGPVVLRRSDSWSAGAAGYIISAKAAHIIAEGDEIRRTATDCAMFNPYEPLAAKLTMRFAYPCLCIQEDANGRAGQSSLAGARQAPPSPMRPTLAKRIWYGARRIVDRDIRVGVLKAWRQFIMGSRKQRVPFLG